MADDNVTSEGGGTAPPPDPAPAKPKAKAKKGRKRASSKAASSKAASSGSKAPKLSVKLTSVLQLVTLAPSPRTPEELANQYAGLREANLWPEQSVDQVQSGIAALLKKKLLREGDEAPDGTKTVELAGAER